MLEDGLCHLSWLKPDWCAHCRGDVPFWEEES